MSVVAAVAALVAVPTGVVAMPLTAPVLAVDVVMALVVVLTPVGVTPPGPTADEVVVRVPRTVAAAALD